MIASLLESTSHFFGPLVQLEAHGYAGFWIFWIFIAVMRYSTIALSAKESIKSKIVFEIPPMWIDLLSKIFGVSLVTGCAMPSHWLSLSTFIASCFSRRLARRYSSLRARELGAGKQHTQRLPPGPTHMNLYTRFIVYLRVMLLLLTRLWLSSQPVCQLLAEIFVLSGMEPMFGCIAMYSIHHLCIQIPEHFQQSRLVTTGWHNDQSSMNNGSGNPIATTLDELLHGTPASTSNSISTRPTMHRM